MCHELVWRNDAVGQVGMRLPESQAKLFLSTNLEYAVNWLVTSVSEAVETIVEAGGKVILEPTQIPVGRLAVAAVGVWCLVHPERRSVESTERLAVML